MFNLMDEVDKLPEPVAKREEGIPDTTLTQGWEVEPEPQPSVMDQVRTTGRQLAKGLMKFLGLTKR